MTINPYVFCLICVLAVPTACVLTTGIATCITNAFREMKEYVHRVTTPNRK